MGSSTTTRRTFLVGTLSLAAVNVIGVARARGGSPLPAWGGSGTPEDPYVVTTVEELQAMRYALGANFVLGNDIDASETASWNDGTGFEPIGFIGQDAEGQLDAETAAPFSGTLDGRGYTIDGLTIDRPLTDEAVGLFSNLTGTVRNLTLTGLDVAGADGVGGLVGVDGDGDLVTVADDSTRATVEDVAVAGTVAGNTGVGGLVGISYGGTFRRCTAAVTVTGGVGVGGFAGGLVGTVSESSATGAVSGGDQVGGFCGATLQATVEESFATGDVTGEQDVGGFTGRIQSGSTITRAYASGDVSGTGYVGGFGGDVTSGMKSEMEVPSTLLSEVYAVGAVTLAEPEYRLTTLSGPLVGGLLGSGDESVVEAGYWDVETTGQPDSEYRPGTGLTTAEMTGSAATQSLVGFDFPGTWYTTASYPRLVWARPPAGDGPAQFTTEDEHGETTVRFSTHTPTVGEEVTISVRVTNVGGASGRYIGNLNDGFVALGRANPRLAGGESTTLTYTVTFEKRGMHRLFLGADHVGDVHVQRA